MRSFCLHFKRDDILAKLHETQNKKEKKCNNPKNCVYLILLICLIFSIILYCYQNRKILRDQFTNVLNTSDEGKLPKILIMLVLLISFSLLLFTLFAGCCLY